MSPAESSSASGTAAGHQNGAPALVLGDLTRQFGHVLAVDGLDLVVQRGELVAFLGPNGAGKTSTIDMILGLSRPTRGTVAVLGLSPRDAMAQGLVSAMLQTGGLLRDLSVRDTLRLVGTLYTSSRTVDEVLARAGLASIAGREVKKCSGGEQQRLRFAMALLPDPELMILDEPTTGMDVAGRRDFWRAIRGDATSGGTVLFATHYLEEADAYADRIVLMSKGRIVADGTPSHIKALASGRMVSGTLPHANREWLGSIPGVTSVEINGDRVAVRAADSDLVARRLLTETAAFDLEITAHNLEDAFMELTSEGGAGGASR